jgi:hypothetical protein
VPVPVFEKNKQRRRFLVHPEERRPSETTRPSTRPLRVQADLSVLPLPEGERIPTKPLSEVADMNRPLGFKGNYMILPMVESNPLTEFMAQPYVTLAEGEFRLTDPDPLGNMTLDEFSSYVCCLKRRSKQLADSGGAESFEAMKPMLRKALQRLIEKSRRNDEEIVIPSDCLFIEALPGVHSILEKFKHLHRQIDVKRAQSDLRHSELENIRRAQRILELDLEDPDIEAKYLFDGAGTAVVAPNNPLPR